MVELVYSVNSVNIAFDLGGFACKSGFRLLSSVQAMAGHLQVPLQALQALQKTAKQLVIEVKQTCRTDVLVDVGTGPIGSFGTEWTRLPR